MIFLSVRQWRHIVETYQRDLFASSAGALDPVAEDDIIRLAGDILSRQLAPGKKLAHPEDVGNYLRFQLAEYTVHEVFAAIFLSNQNCVLSFEILFTGTIAGATVYPREVVRRALELGANAVIFAHNHPSGVVEPSELDRSLTKRLQEALALMDIRVLDHFVIGAEVSSFATMGLL